MSIQKKSLISTLQTTKKANVARESTGLNVSMTPGKRSPVRRVAAAKSPAKKAAAKKAAALKSPAKKAAAAKSFGKM